MTTKTTTENVHDEGAITLFVIIMAVALFAAIGLVVDAGGRVHAIQTADRTAREAARAAGQQINGSIIDGVNPEPDTAAAARAARAYLQDAGVSGTVAVSGRTVHVSTQVTYDPIFLSIIGVGRMTLTGEADARATRGVTEEMP
jgi:hypothetical protein